MTGNKVHLKDFKIDIRWTGEGRSIAKMVWIDPYEKHGYIKRAMSDKIIP